MRHILHELAARLVLAATWTARMIAGMASVMKASDHARYLRSTCALLLVAGVVAGAGTASAAPISTHFHGNLPTRFGQLSRERGMPDLASPQCAPKLQGLYPQQRLHCRPR
jgi:hypothetical protein